MNRKIIPFVLALVPTLILIVVVSDVYRSRHRTDTKPVEKETVLGTTSAQTHFGDVSVSAVPTLQPTVNPSPTIVMVTTVPLQHEIHMVDYPTSLYVGANAAFTWDVYGPAATSGFIAIVGSNVSRPGALDTSFPLGMTPYTVMVSDFTKDTYAVPLRFVGNAGVKDPGTYYFRALAFIDGKNIWSDEYSFIVK